MIETTVSKPSIIRFCLSKKIMATIVCPSITDLAAIIKTHGANLIPLFAKIPSDLLTPVSAFLKLSRDEKFSFLFESAESGSIGRYSIMGSKPTNTIITGNRFQKCVDPLCLLENEFSSTVYYQPKELPCFAGGAVGYLTFECCQYFEPRTKKIQEDSLQLPESMFGFYEEVVVFDNYLQCIYIISHYKQDKSGIISQKEYDRACRSIFKIADKLNELTPNDIVYEDITNNTEIEYNMTKQEFMDIVSNLKTHIENGDIIQAVPSQRMRKRTNVDAFTVYRQLRALNPSPYMFFMNMGDHYVVGASPEVLCKVQKRKVFTHPIAGTRRRSDNVDDELDEIISQELLNDEKENAEHVMLVDLGRNDLNRVCVPLSVKVDSFMNIEKYKHVIHIVSKVSGTLRSECSQWDAFRSIFPAGTVSGAPKVRALELIGEMENEKRGIYSGAIGYFAYNGDIDTAIAIRTIVFKDGYAYFQAGAGIVHDSNPENEYDETLNKLRSNLKALQLAEKFHLSSRKKDLL